MSLTITTRLAAENSDLGEVTIALGGKLDTATAPDLEKVLNATLATKPGLLIFDLAELVFVTSMGIRLFFMAQKKQKEVGASVSFVNLRPQIKEVFIIMGTMPDVTIFQDTAGLDAYLLSQQGKRLRTNS